MKYNVIQGVLATLLNSTSSKTLVDVGCNTGLVAFIANQLGFSKVFALDHDADAVKVVRTIAAERTLSVVAKEFTFGETPIPPADIVYCGALIHWVFCLTANFEGSFRRVLQYLVAQAPRILIIEWVAPEDRAIRSFHHIEKCSGPLEDTYTTKAFEAALSHMGTIEHRVHTDTTRVLYVLSSGAVDSGRDSFDISQPDVRLLQALALGECLHQILKQQGGAVFTAVETYIGNDGSDASAVPDPGRPGYM
eukprot:CAMPEP_0181184346 /NCGR_PEP_ID=MMETSP1096-20121128/8915_1 /TAXON_ID=156174 ORGANISM="Chrysochromulina ericina, Strain CCMP281" /NCGR_SAMPLE_ID=MMETSP1096 /ASSEMBLY_ACC=CAM_ASM_000453 /LENGTH=249 /DNA_ID=CAMNT_0023273097 /DNA_START=19 /DNA_END=769 /DNA_ORIENTATION=-